MEIIQTIWEWVSWFFTAKDLFYLLLISLLIYIWLRNGGWKHLRSVTRPSLRDKRLQYVYTDKFGHKYYIYKNVLDMGVKRELMCKMAAETAKFNIRRDEFREKHKEMVEHANTGEMTKVFAILNELDERIWAATDEQLLLDLSALYFMRGDEDISDPTPELARRKIESWKVDSHATAFFLNGAWAFLLQLTNNSEGIIPTVLETEDPAIE